MPPSPSIPSPQSPPVETAHDHSFVTADSPEQAQLGTPSGPAALSALQRSATLGSLLDELDRQMTENTSNDTRSPTRRAPNTPTRVLNAVPDPVAAAPNAPRAAAQPSPTGNQAGLSIAGRMLVFFGYGRNNRARKELVSLISSLVVDISQVRHIVGCPTFGRRRNVLFVLFGSCADYRDYHLLDHLDAPHEPHEPRRKRVERMREAAGYMGRPLDRPPFPRYLAQRLALVPRAHETAPGRKVSQSGPGSARTGLKLFFPAQQWTRA